MTGCPGAVTTRALRNSAYNNVFIASKTSPGGGNAVNLTGEGGGATRNFVAYKGLDSAGKHVCATLATPEDLRTRQARGESQWAVQRTLRYEF